MFKQWMETACISSSGFVTRRSFLHSAALGTGAAGIAGMSFSDRLLAEAPNLRKRQKAMILLWMQGGPSQFETFDPKTHADVKGETTPIDTAVPGIQIGDFWPNVAKQMKDISLIRSVTNKEGAHPRATYQLHTGYIPSGGLRHPTFGSLVASEIGDKNFDLPSFVSVIGPSESVGFLPTPFAPFRVSDPSALPANVALPVADRRFDRRMNLLSDLDRNYAQSAGAQLIDDHQGVYRTAAKLVKSPHLTAFDVSKEPKALQERYGSSPFAKGCLLARRLVETGVSFVEVQLGNWDTHFDNHAKVKDLAGQCDSAFATLVADLKERGRLQDTLVVWMGEFGRTPKINARGGRDHFPRAFTVAAAGGGIVGGRVVGKTSIDGNTIEDRPVSVPELFHTFAHCLGINPAKENQTPVGRPLKIVDGGAKIKELLAT